MQELLSRVINVLIKPLAGFSELAPLRLAEGEKVLRTAPARQGSWFFPLGGELILTERRLYFRPLESKFAERRSATRIIELNAILSLGTKPQSWLRERFDAPHGGGFLVIDTTEGTINLRVSNPTSWQNDIERQKRIQT
jgi:hypothetical protein